MPSGGEMLAQRRGRIDSRARKKRTQPLERASVAARALWVHTYSGRTHIYT